MTTVMNTIVSMMFTIAVMAIFFYAEALGNPTG